MDSYGVHNMASVVQHRYLQAKVSDEISGHDVSHAYLPEHELFLQAVVKDDLEDCVAMVHNIKACSPQVSRL